MRKGVLDNRSIARKKARRGRNGLRVKPQLGKKRRAHGDSLNTVKSDERRHNKGGKKGEKKNDLRRSV